MKPGFSDSSLENMEKIAQLSSPTSLKTILKFPFFLIIPIVISGFYTCQEILTVTLMVNVQFPFWLQLNPLHQQQLLQIWTPCLVLNKKQNWRQKRKLEQMLPLKITVKK